MDNKNVFVAIALSMSVLLFWGAFFETPRKPIDQKNNQKVEEKVQQDTIAPTINQPKTIKKLSKNFPKTFQKLSKNFPKSFQKLSKNFPTTSIKKRKSKQV